MIRVAVLGAGGQLGAAVARQWTGDGAAVLALGRQELDVTAYERLSRLAEWRPDVIVNCTAYNHVDRAEEEPDAAMAVNCDAVGALARTANQTGAILVHYSSDFVFDGMSRDPYRETDTANPLGAYGRSKLAGEQRAAEAARHYVLRLSSVFGGAGRHSTIDRITDATLAGAEVRAFDDRTVSPSYTVDVSWATSRLLALEAPFGTYHCGSSDWSTWAELAGEIARVLGIPPRLVAVSMQGVPMPARRPLRCALSVEKLAALGIAMPGWREALRRHLAEREPARSLIA